ncbi:hypothetical protein HK102_003370 [Quaeritorhiza haematococci]|nr:hypothetical protein HK102_003370 [Quaeritorhiza haematococci]
MSAVNNTDAQTASNDLQTFVTVLITNCALAIAFYVAFELVRTLAPLVYAPRTFLVPKSNQPPPIPRGIFLWATRLLSTSDRTFIDRAGPDAFAAYSFVRWCARLFGLLAFALVAVLIPINVTGGKGLTGLAQLTMANNLDERRLWAHVIMTGGVTVITLRTIMWILEESVKLRHRYLLSREHRTTLSAYTLLIRDIPTDHRNPATLRRLFERILPGAVRDVVLVRDVKDLPSLCKTQEQTRIKLESVATGYIRSQILVIKKAKETAKKSGSTTTESVHFEAERPKTKTGFLGLWGEKVDAIEHYRDSLLETTSKIRVGRDLTLDHRKPLNSAFIVFNDQLAVHAAAAAPLHDRPFQLMDKHTSINGDDIIWSSLDLTLEKRSTLRSISVGITAFLVLGWAAISSLIVTIAQLDKLVALVPWLEPVLDLSPAGKGLLKGILPTVALSVAYSMIPPLMRLLSRFEGMVSSGAIEQRLQTYYFAFLVFNGFLIVTITGSVLQALDGIVKNPASILEMLSRSIPQVSNFYVNYVLLLGIFGPANELLRTSDLIVTPLKLWLLGKTPRSIHEASQPPQFFGGTTYAQHGLVATIGIVYSTIAPLVTVFVAAYFGFYALVSGYNMQYVFKQPFETGGLFMHSAAKHLFTGLYIHLLTVFALFYLNGAWVQGTICLVLIVATAVTHTYANRGYTTLIASLPLKAAIDAALSSTGEGRAENGGSGEERPESPTPNSPVDSNEGLRRRGTGAGSEEGSGTEEQTPLLMREYEGPEDHQTPLLHPSIRVPATGTPPVWIPKDVHGSIESARSRGEIHRPDGESALLGPPIVTEASGYGGESSAASSVRTLDGTSAPLSGDGNSDGAAPKPGMVSIPVAGESADAGTEAGEGISAKVAAILAPVSVTMEGACIDEDGKVHLTDEALINEAP